MTLSFAVLFLVACSSLDVEVFPTEVSLMVDKASAAVGEDVTFDLEATGTFLTDIVLDFGDGTPRDSLNTGGATHSALTRIHRFEDPGDYTVTATIYDLTTAGTTPQTVSDTKEVEVRDPEG